MLGKKTDKTPRIQFLHDEERRAKDAVERELARKKAREESEKLQKTLRDGKTDLNITQAAIVDGVIQIMQERDAYHVKADLYDEARHWLRGAGYWWPSAVEHHPTVLEMAEHLAQHRSNIQGFLETALKHLGVDDEMLTKLRSGEMQEFYEQHKGAIEKDLETIRKAIEPALPKNEEGPEFTRAPNYDDILYRNERGSWPNGERPAWAKERDTPTRTLSDTELELIALEYEHSRLKKQYEAENNVLSSMRAATAEVQEKLADVLEADEEDTKTSWGAITALAAKRMEQIEQWKGYHKRASIEAGQLKEALAERTDRAGELETQLEALKDHDERYIQDLEKHVADLQDEDETEAGVWKMHYVDLCRHVDIPDSVRGEATSPNVAEVSGYIGKYYEPVRKLQARVDIIDAQLRDVIAEAEDVKKQNGWKCCGEMMPTEMQFCPSCGKSQSNRAVRPRYKFNINDRVELTFKEAVGERGTVVDAGTKFDVPRQYEYADVRLDRDGTHTGPMPVTCMRKIENE